MHSLWRGFQRSTKGANLVEYALLIGVIAVGAMAILPDVRVAITSLMEPIIDTLGATVP